MDRRYSAIRIARHSVTSRNTMVFVRYLHDQHGHGPGRFQRDLLPRSWPIANASARLQYGCVGPAVASFPLTLALSPGGRETRSPRLDEIMGLEAGCEGEFFGVRRNVEEWNGEVAVSFVGMIWSDGFFARRFRGR